MARKKSKGGKVKAYCPYCRKMMPAKQIGYLIRCIACENRID